MIVFLVDIVRVGEQHPVVHLLAIDLLYGVMDAAIKVVVECAKCTNTQDRAR